MDISFFTDKTLVIPEGAPMLLKTENLEAECRWQKIHQEGELFSAEGIAEFRLAYLTLAADTPKECSYEKLLLLLDEAACEPQIKQLQHFLTLQCPVELCEQLTTEKRIIGLQLGELRHSIISPRALEINMEFHAELQTECSAEEIYSAEAEKPESLTELLTEEQPKEETAEAEELCQCEIAADNNADPPKQEAAENPACTETTEISSMNETPRFASRFRQQTSSRSKKESGGYCMKFYRVREGDSLWTIAEKMQVPAAQISQLNHLEDGEITVGMLLSIPN